MPIEIEPMETVDSDDDASGPPQRYSPPKEVVKQDSVPSKNEPEPDLSFIDLTLDNLSM